MVQLSDPIATLLFSVLVVYSTKAIVADSVRILMQSAPDDHDIDSLFMGILTVKGVIGVHHLHVWSINAHDVSLSVHVLVRNEAELNAVLKRVQHYLRQKDLSHNTIQMEVASADFCDGLACKETEAEGAVCEGYGEACNAEAGDGVCYTFSEEKLSMA